MVTIVWVVQYNLGLRSLLVLHIHISPSTSSGQRNCASWASQPQKSVTLRPQRGGETTKSIRDMWWHWQKIKIHSRVRFFRNAVFDSFRLSSCVIVLFYLQSYRG